MKTYDNLQDPKTLVQHEPKMMPHVSKCIVSLVIVSIEVNDTFGNMCCHTWLVLYDNLGRKTKIGRYDNFARKSGNLDDKAQIAH